MEIYKSTYVNSINTYKKEMQKIDNINKKENTKKDTIQISNEAKKISESLNDKDVNSEKVESIKKSIENGTYKIDYEGLAKKILDKVRG